MRFFASSSQMYFSHFCTPHLATAQPRTECCTSVAGDHLLRAGLAEGIGRTCLWQPHCLKLQEISWATATARHWYDCCWIYSSRVWLAGGRDRQVCLFHLKRWTMRWLKNVCSAVRVAWGRWWQRLGPSSDAPTQRQSQFKRFSLPPSSCSQVRRKSFGSNLFWSGLTWSLHTY